jgi:LacI family transcriptional regulator
VNRDGPIGPVNAFTRHMSHRIRLQDVARLAGVGTATVDRVLNERGNVSLKTAEKVLGAARQLHLHRILPKSHRKMVRIEILLARLELPLIDRMNREFAKLGRSIDRSIVIHRTVLKSEDPFTLAAAIRSTKCDSVVVYTQSHDAIHSAIADAKDRGVPVVTMISDLPQSVRLAYAGTDHYAAGRTAAFFMSRMVCAPGPVIVLCNHFGFQSHERRVRGFTDALAEYGSALSVTEVLEGGDDSRRSERLLSSAFRRLRHTIGIYNVGAANDAVAAALRQSPLDRPPVFIGHELTGETRPLLADGTMTLAIDQNPEHQARFAVDVLLHHFGFDEMTTVQPPYRSNVAFQLYSRENVNAPEPPPAGQ